MGLQQSVQFDGQPPAWPQVQARLAEQGHEAAMRMIDGEPAFPDEDPPADWRELRVAIAGGMVTIQRQDAGLTLMVWGNADADLLAARDAIAQAFADLAA